MGKDHKTPQAELDISWRTRELGPEMRRALFRKVLPSVKFAARDVPSAAGEEGHASDAAPQERRRGSGGRRASDRERRRDEPDSP